MLKPKNITVIFSIFIMALVLITGYAVVQFNSDIKKRKALQVRLEKLQGELKEAKETANPLRQEIADLKKSLENKEQEGAELKKQINQAQSDIKNYKEELTRTKAGINELSNELKLVQNDKASLEKINLKINTSLQDATKKDITAKHSASSNVNKSLAEQTKQLDAGRLSLHNQLAKANEQLSQQNELISSLKNNLNSLADSLAKKEEEKNRLTLGLAEINTLKLSQEERLKQQEQQLKEINEEYNNQKLQITRLTGILTNKELELDNRGQEVLAFKDEIANLQLRLADLEKELAAARQQQRKVIEDFGEVTKLNVTLQERLGGLSQALGQEAGEKKKAEELKRKIEVILKPTESGKKD